MIMHTEKEDAAANWLKETRKGYLRIAVLTLLSRKPYHGYEIMKEIKERTGGFWKPTPGGIYPVLQSLEKSGYVEGKWDSGQRRRRKTYRITETGRPLLKQALTRQNQIASSMSDLFREYMKDVLDVKSATMPPVPNLFSPFFEERKEKPEDTVSVLEHKRSHIDDAIEALEKEREAIDRRLAKMESRKKKASHKELK
jgi:DNA-binding PadR family transcriptional regulator